MDIAASTPAKKSKTITVNIGAVIAFGSIAIPALLQLILDPANKGLLSSIIPPKYFVAFMSAAGTAMALWNVWRRYQTTSPIAGTQAAALNEQVLTTALAMPPTSTIADLSKVVTVVNANAAPTTPPGEAPSPTAAKQILQAPF